MDAKTLELMASMKQRNSERGLDVRCPTCNHGIGQFCTEDDVRHISASDIVVHPARVELARAQGFIS